MFLAHRSMVRLHFDPSESEKYNKIEYAEKELLESGIKETTGETLRGYGKVIIKLCF